MLIETRTLGRTTRPLDKWTISDPPAGRDGGGLTLRELIARVVRAEIGAFERRERARRLVCVIADVEIAEGGAARWRIDPGGRPSAGPVDFAARSRRRAVGSRGWALPRLFDGTEQREPDCEVFIRPDSKLLSFRLTFLAGAGRVYRGKVAAVLAGSREEGAVLQRLDGLKHMASVLTGRGHPPSHPPSRHRRLRCTGVHMGDGGYQLP